MELSWLKNDTCVCLCFREAAGHLNGLREKLDEVNWTVGAVNHTFSNDISVHHLKIQDLQVLSSSQLTRSTQYVKPAAEF